MGLPGSGKTTFAEKVVREFNQRNINPTWFNADTVRKQHDDWDFSEEGRLRQAQRMRRLVDNSIYPYCIVDMVAPTVETRKILKPDYLIWMNTIDEGRFADTNEMFNPPNPNEWMVMLPEFGGIREAKAVVNMATNDYEGSSLMEKS